MYTSTTIHEDVHINNEGDVALLEAIKVKIPQKFKDGAMSTAGKAAMSGLILAGTTAAKDYVEHGDALHTAKEIKKKIDENKAKREAEKQKEKDEQEYEDWKNGRKKSKDEKALKENCQFFIDEAAGTAYYAFSIPEGA